MLGMLDVLLLLAFASTIGVTALKWHPMGPEGPVGAWALLLIPCLFVAALLLAMVAKGALDFLPGGRPVQLLVAVGALIPFFLGVSALPVDHDGPARGLMIAVAYLILVGCAASIYRAHLPQPRLVLWTAGILLGGAALAGWGLAGTGLFVLLQRDLEQATRKAQEERSQEEEHLRQAAEEYAALGESPPLHVLLRFTLSRNDQVCRQATERVRDFPGLDDGLIELLDVKNETVIDYVAKVYEDPPARLAPAWGRMLRRELKSWDRLRFDDHAGSWEYNLRPYFDGARKIQRAGGSLRAELEPWHEHLKKCKGLGGLAASVEDLLESEPS